MEAIVSWRQSLLCVGAACLLSAGLVQPAHAHLMLAQRGTLNVVGDGAFMVLSLPVSAFNGVDDDHDGKLSPEEVQKHAQALSAQVQRGVQLLDGDRALPLQGILLQLSPDDANANANAGGAARQLIVLGRFALAEHRRGLRFRLSLFGPQAGEGAQEISVSQGSRVQRLLLAPGREEGKVLPSAGAVFADHMTQGLSHVFGGLDHMLFLLVVLASGWDLRRAMLALSCFTAGHAITLAASALGGVSLQPAIVEPAIAATIVGMALFDRWVQLRRLQGRRAVPETLRLALIFVFALIHGLGLAGGLSDLGLDLRDTLWSLAGFNVGVELAQVAIACVAWGLLWVLARLRMPALLNTAHRLASATAVVAGLFWLVQRVALLA